MAYGSGGDTLELPAGPYLRVEVSGALVVGTVSFGGTISIERSIRPGFTGTTLTVVIDETALAAGDLDKDGDVDLVAARGTSAYRRPARGRDPGRQRRRRHRGVRRPGRPA